LPLTRLDHAVAARFARLSCLPCRLLSARDDELRTLRRLFGCRLYCGVSVDCCSLLGGWRSWPAGRIDSACSVFCRNINSASWEAICCPDEIAAFSLAADGGNEVANGAAAVAGG
jgi:hypothetical protein